MSWALRQPIVYMQKYLRKISYASAENDDKSGVRYPADFTSVGFQSQVEESRVSFHTEMFWHHKTVSLSLYIYIYI